MQHTGGSEGMCCTLVYLSDGEDASRISDPGLSENFRTIHRLAEEQGFLYTTVENASSGRTSAMELTTHFADNFDEIGFHILRPVFQETIRSDNPGKSDLDAMILLSEKEKQLNKALLAAHPGRYFRLWQMNFVKGAVNSILRYHRLLNAAAALLFILYGALLALGARRGKNGPLCRMGLLILWTVLLNSAVVGAVIYPQPRYMIYMMPLFYSQLAAMFMESGVK